VKKLNLERKPVQPVEASRLPFVEWKKITFIALPAIALLSLLQALSNQGSLEPWLIWLAFGFLFFLILGVFLGIRYSAKLNFAPLTIFLLVSPVLVGDRASQPWISIGLVCMAAVIYFSVISNIYLAIFTSLVITLWQAYIASLNLSSVSDSRDINYFYTYFATTWMLAVGLGSILIRRRYQEVAEEVDGLVSDSLNETVGYLQKIQESNVSDSNNLRLHGTILNTLIYLKNTNFQKMQGAEIRKIILSDLKGLRSPSSKMSPANFGDQIRTSLEERALRRIRINLVETKIEILNQVTVRGVTEILREQVLNLEKHTDLEAVEISFSSNMESGIQVLTKVDAPKGIDAEAAEELVAAFRRSISLEKLFGSYRASFSVWWDSASNQIIQEVFIPYLDFKEELRTSIAEVRFTGLNDFAINYVRISIFSGFLALAGFAVSGIPLVEWLLVASLALGLLFATEKSNSNLPLVVTSLLSASVLPFIFRIPNTCDDVLILPWIWNLLLVNGFLVALRVRNLFLQSLPLFVLFVQSYFYPQSLPASCQDILDGSLPAIPLIAILAINVIRVRNREFDLDVQRVEESALEFSTYGEINQGISQQYEKLISELESFALTQDFDLPEGELNRVFELQIQKIRAYLVSIEKYDSALIRAIYSYVSNRLSMGLPTRLSLLGEFNSQLDSSIDIARLLIEIEELIAQQTVEIILAATEELEVSIIYSSGAVPVSSKLPQIDGVTFELSTQ
jgi:hypothetical protein